MMHWILIVWIATGSSSYYNTSTITAIFEDQNACKQAYQEMRNIKSADQGIWGVCVTSATKLPDGAR